MKDKQKQLLTEVMNADAKDGLYKKQTAVEWLMNELANTGLLVTKDIDNLVAYRKAKQMEKEQIMIAHGKKINGGFRSNGDFFHEEITAEQYYNETYENTTH